MQTFDWQHDPEASKFVTKNWDKKYFNNKYFLGIKSKKMFWEYARSIVYLNKTTGNRTIAWDYKQPLAGKFKSDSGLSGFLTTKCDAIGLCTSTTRRTGFVVANRFLGAVASEYQKTHFAINNQRLKISNLREL
jgi:hypothetical protein